LSGGYNQSGISSIMLKASQQAGWDQNKKIQGHGNKANTSKK
jgi:hypothetical protein